MFQAKAGYWEYIQARRAPLSLFLQGHPTLEIPAKAITGGIKLEFEIDEDMPVNFWQENQVSTNQNNRSSSDWPEGPG